MLSTSAWRATLRIARRDALRAKGRSALVVAMIALPVLGVTAADVTARSAQLTPQESATRLMGAADAYVRSEQPGWRLEQAPNPQDGFDVPSQRGPAPKPTAQEVARAKEPLDQLLRQALPPGARLLPVETPNQYVDTSTAYGQEPVQPQGMDLTDPAAHGLVTLRQGGWPSAPYEVAATTAFLAVAGLHVGQDTTLVGTGRPLRITAAIEFPGDLSAERLVGRPGELAGLLAASASKQGGQGGQDGQIGQTAGPGDPGAAGWLVSLPDHAAFSWDQVRRANDYGFTVASRAVLADPPSKSDVPLYRDNPILLSASGVIGSRSATILGIVVGMALLEIVLLAGPAFAVGARRSRRQLGLIAAGGGSRAHIRRVVLGGGVVLGGLGAVVGMVLGGLAVALGRPWLEAKSGARFGHFALAPGDLLGIVAIGVVTGLLAAVVPAYQAARQNVVAALTGRGTTRPPARWFTLLGLAAVLGGASLALFGAVDGSRSRVVMVGSMVAELGVVACTPYLVGLFGRLSPFLPLAPRLALRDATRHRGRTAPAVAAVMAAVAGAVAVLTSQTSSDAAARSQYAASAPSGAVTLRIFGGDTDANRAGALRSAVEQSIPGLGQRADLQEVTYGSCTSRQGSFCGMARLSMPAENMCPPAAMPGASSNLGAGITVEEAKRLLAADPRCRPSVPMSYELTDLITGDTTVLHNLLGVDDPAAGRALAQGRVVVFDPRFVKNGKVTLTLTRYGAASQNGTVAPDTSSTVTLPAVVVRSKVPVVRAVLSSVTAKAAGLTLGSPDSVWLPAQAPSSAAEQRASAAIARTGGHGDMSVERGYQGTSSDVVVLGLAIAASVVAVAAAGIATGLAAADSQGDLATLAAVGATPGIRRRLSGFQCAVIAGMGALLGTAAGFVPAAAVERVQNLGIRPSLDQFGGIDMGTHPLVVPWAYLAVVVFGLPLLAWLLAAGFTRSRMVLTRRTG
ncbi:putative ABC transport system permease protein [Streptacidiphilus sp. MAP12-16]|uniref:FtsX-like permease family protein n=1 Tax=Streptacidiphilus sp. MAP12-16 TaxID=3156300 RepID=UPI0035188EE7